MPNRIVVVGSTNMDLTAHVPRLPEKGETILGGELSVALGGKGANQAVAAARLGADVMFITALGKGAYGQQALASLLFNTQILLPPYLLLNRERNHLCRCNLKSPHLSKA
jgi:fructose-1-phosphate kinase PfkB-like protein